MRAIQSRAPRMVMGFRPRRFFSEKTDEKKEKEERSSNFNKFSQPYQKPDFLKDDYDHLKKDE